VATQTQSVSNTNKAKEISIDDLSSQIELLKKDIASLTSTIGELGKSKSAQAQAQAKKKVEDLTESGREKVMETQIQAEEFIRTQPGTALGIAAGIGFLVGLVTARR
jgi:ElaB/YqjD/DUF883 family membrane-anchored ribosome-binding protein